MASCTVVSLPSTLLGMVQATARPPGQEEGQIRKLGDERLWCKHLPRVSISVLPHPLRPQAMGCTLVSPGKGKNKPRADLFQRADSCPCARVASPDSHPTPRGPWHGRAGSWSRQGIHTAATAGLTGLGKNWESRTSGDPPAPHPEQQEPLGSHHHSTSVEQEGEQT